MLLKLLSCLCKTEPWIFCQGKEGVHAWICWVWEWMQRVNKFKKSSCFKPHSAPFPSEWQHQFVLVSCFAVWIILLLGGKNCYLFYCCFLSCSPFLGNMSPFKNFLILVFCHFLTVMLMVCCRDWTPKDHGLDQFYQFPQSYRAIYWDPAARGCSMSSLQDFRKWSNPH